MGNIVTTHRREGDMQISENPPKTDRQKVLDWLARIGETDEACINEVLEQCKTDPDARRYYVMRSKEVCNG